MSTEKKKKFPLIIIVIAAFGLAIAGGYLFQIILHSSKNEPNSSITKVESEDDDGKSDVDVSLKYAGYVTLLSDENLITLNFTNPSKSKKSLDLEIVADIGGEDVVLAKTDRIYPGYKIDSVKYALDREISKGNYDGKFIVHFYNEQDKEEIINSEIAINVYVK